MKQIVDAGDIELTCFVFYNVQDDLVNKLIDLFLDNYKPTISMKKLFEPMKGDVKGISYLFVSDENVFSLHYTPETEPSYLSAYIVGGKNNGLEDRIIRLHKDGDIIKMNNNRIEEVKRTDYLPKGKFDPIEKNLVVYGVLNGINKDDFAKKVIDLSEANIEEKSECGDTRAYLLSESHLVMFPIMIDNKKGIFLNISTCGKTEPLNSIEYILSNTLGGEIVYYDKRKENK